MEHLPNSGVVGAVFKGRKCAALDNLDNPQLLSPKSRRSGMRGKFDEETDNIPGIKVLSSTICIPLADAEDSKKVVAVLQLANKTNMLPFNRQDEFMLKGFGNQVVMLLQSALLVDESQLCERLHTQLMCILESMHELQLERHPREDSAFHKWIEESAAELVVGGRATLFWISAEGRTKHPQNLNPHSVNAVQNVLTSGEHEIETNSERTKASLYVPVQGNAEVLGILEVELKIQDRDVPGDWLFNKLEVTFMDYLAEHIAAFLDCGIFPPQDDDH